MDNHTIEGSKEEVCYFALTELREEYGTSAFDAAIRRLMRERLSAGDRPKRTKWKWPGDYRKMYERQRGICPRCNKEMAFVRGGIEIDHIDPLASDFNGTDNLRVLHKSCNASKGANDAFAEAKRLGMTVKDLLEKQRGEHG